MNQMYKCSGVITLSLLLGSCLSETESEFDRIAARDDAILLQYIESNEIDAIKTQSGFYYTKLQTVPDADEFENNDYIGFYYEMRTLDGQLVKSYMDETKEPVIFQQTTNGIAPLVLSYATGMSKVGEELMVYSPSYLAYNNYGYQQMLLPNSNLAIRIKYVRKYTEDELRAREDQMILDYIEENQLEGFEKIADGIYRRILDEGDAEKQASATGSSVVFDFELYQLGDSEITFKSTEGSRPNLTIGLEGNLKFLDEGLKGVKQDAEVEVLAYSFAAYDRSIQIVPVEIRKDLYSKGENIDLVRPFTPVYLKTEIWSVL